MNDELLPAPIQSNDATAKRMANLRPFPKGVSGNPGGRKRGLERRVRELVGDDGDAIATFLVDVFKNEAGKMGDRLEAARILLERGWGKAPVVVSSDGEPAQFMVVSAFAATVNEST